MFDNPIPRARRAFPFVAVLQSDLADTPVSLHPHPGPLSPGEGGRRILASAQLEGEDSLRLRYVLEAELRRVRIPRPTAHPGRADKLWVHTCFEAFVQPPGTSGYVELNFSPSGEWSAYRFASYREGMVAVELPEAPRLEVRRGEGRLELQAEVRLGAGLLMPRVGSAAGASDPAGERSRVRIALSAVVEDHEGRLSYWALRHPAAKPDFHHPESFALALEPPRTIGP